MLRYQLVIYCCNCNLFLYIRLYGYLQPPLAIHLDDFWAYQVVVLADQVSRYTMDVVRTEADLNQSQWRVLAAVSG